MVKLFLIFICFFSFNNLFAVEWKKYGSEFLTPFQKPTLCYFLGGTSLSLGIKYFGQDAIVMPIQRELSKNDFLGNFDQPLDYMGQLVPNIVYSVGFGVHGYFAENPRSSTLAEKMFKAMIYSSAMTVTLKRIVHEKRPNGGNYLSFPSGHTTTAFAFASVVGANHPWYFGVPAYLMASMVGVQRINSNSHYLHDVLMGATIGISYGIGLSKKINPNVVVLPIVDSTRTGLILVKNF